MQEIIDYLGENTILIIFGVIVLIVVALVIIILIEKRSKKKYLEAFSSLEKYEETEDNFEQINLEENIEKTIILDEYKIEKNNEEKEKKIEEPKKEEVVYQESLSKTEAKKAIEEAAKKLVYEEQNDIIGQTFFEKMQEENSIISYEELMSKNIDVDYENDKVLEDEGNEPITIDELYSYKEENTVESIEEEKTKEEEKQYKINVVDETSLSKIDEQPKEKEEMVYYVNSESKKFKNSEVISPVFGIKRDVIYKKEYNELGETINIKELDMEIKRTEEFLKELKKLKSKLD